MVKLLQTLLFVIVSFVIAAMITGALGTMDTVRLLLIWAAVAAAGKALLHLRDRRHPRPLAHG
ncbi:hypothetical protein [Nostocoides vanveenii]|uniref:DUF1328 domain-containing protein n=1 Tax=Nostocoides vanveenii TaxID=330835 RepID=A0ABP4X6V5_9MICO